MIYRFNNVSSGLAKDHDRDCGFAVQQAERPNILDGIGHCRHVPQSHRSAISVSNDQRFIFACQKQLIRRSDGPCPVAIGNLSFGAIGIRGAQHGTHFLKPDTEMVQDGWINVHAYRRRRTATNADLANSLNLSQSLSEYGCGSIVHHRLRMRFRCDCDDHDRRIGRVHFPIRRIIWHVGRQLTSSGIYGRLNISSGGVNVSIQIKLHCDGRRAKRTGRRHFRNARDSSELPLQRSRNRGCHRFWTGPGKRRVHTNRWIVNLW